MSFHALANWRPALGEEFPSCQFDYEIVIFESFFHYRFNVPPSKFLRSVLDFYEIELHHLNPNSTTMLSVFVDLCEAFLGIEPSLNLF